MGSAWTIPIVMLLTGLLLGPLEAQAQEQGQAPERGEVIPDANLFVHLQLPKAQAMVFYRAWTQANTDLENGRVAEARRGFATVLALLDEMESSAAQRERAILAKAQLHARVLGDRVTARRELARALVLNPKSAEALTLETQLKFEERKRQPAPGGAAPPVELIPRAGLQKEGTP